MKLILSRIGKIINTLKRDGILRGGQRVTRALFAMFRRVGSGDILFITGGVGDSARFRAENVAEELELHGFRCAITIQDNPLLPSYASKFKIFIFHRTINTPAIAKLIEKIKAQGKEIIFETDDLVFDPQYLQHMDYYQKMNFFEKKLYENGVGGEILADPYVKICTTTTSFLAEKLREKNKKVFIIHNKLSNSDLMIAENVLRAKPERKDGKIRIGYFSGTISHNKDFATITDALLRIMEKYPQTQLYLAGPLDIENRLSIFQERIFQMPFAPRQEHFANIASVDINVSPLELGNPFCEGKSELKFFEAGIVKVPTIATATKTFREAIADGIDGFVASSTDEWVEKLEKLIQDKEARLAMGERAYQKTLGQYSNKNSHDEEYYSYLKTKLN
jgi:glycosyltransferase involved in cell wall biosynthesis